MDNLSRPSLSRGSSEVSSTSTEPRTLLFGEIPSFAEGQCKISMSCQRHPFLIPLFEQPIAQTVLFATLCSLLARHF
jgi:hypothetical protein